MREHYTSLEIVKFYAQQFFSDALEAKREYEMRARLKSLDWKFYSVQSYVTGQVKNNAPREST